jgi:L-ascorbate 6-phosphate lactonase
MNEIRAYPVPRGAVALWWFGQSGYIFKNAEGTTLGVDLYLSDSCNGIAPGVDLSRKVPVLIEPEELNLDLFACTHNHQDHTDPETVRRLRNRDTTHFIGPAPSCGVFRSQGIEEGRIVTAWPLCELEFPGVKIHGTFALPTDDSDLNHMGFVFEFAGGGPKVYITGDTDYHELLASAARYRPELMLTVINGGFNNLSHFEAAVLAAQIRPRVAIPSHYDMFPDNHVDPGQFRASLSIRAPEVRYRELRHGEPFLFGVDL